MNPQITKEGYNFSKYCTIERWSSYWHQINEIVGRKPATVLEVGIGDRVVINYLKQNTDIVCTTADIAADLNPDVVCSIGALSFPDAQFDVACSFEVLEHLPFEKFEGALRELARVSKKYIIISLPHWGRHFSFEFRLPFFGKVCWSYKFNGFPIAHVFRGQHYWEIGKKGFPVSIVKEKIIAAGLRIENDFVVFESPYHHFFILSK